MTLKACPQCGYRYNAPENTTCGKCQGWLGAPDATASAAVAQPRRSLAPRSLPEFACYLPVPIGALLGWPNPIGAAFGLLMGALLIKVVRLEMERFSKGLLIGIVIAGVFFVYLLFLLIFSFLYDLLEPVLQPLVGRSFKH
jgi:hypothetical protein